MPNFFLLFFQFKLKVRYEKQQQQQTTVLRRLNGVRFKFNGNLQVILSQKRWVYKHLYTIYLLLYHRIYIYEGI